MNRPSSREWREKPGWVSEEVQYDPREKGQEIGVGIREKEASNQIRRGRSRVVIFQ